MVLTMSKLKSYSIAEFMSGKHKEINKHANPLYKLSGMYISSGYNFDSSAFNAPYYVVLGVAGFILMAALIENTLISNGNQRKAEMVNSLTGFLLPVAFYLFLVIGILKVL